MTEFTPLTMPGVRDLRPYEPGKPISELERELGISDIIKLASNENPLGPSPRAVQAVREAVDDLALYPDGNGFALKRALADKHGVGMDRITLGSGSDHILDLVARCFLGPGRSAVVSRFAFAIYTLVTKGASAELRVAEALPPDHGTAPYGHDLEAMLAAVDETTRVVFIANPNNPTGTYVPRDALESFLERLPEEVVVVLDEAYHEYVQASDYPDASDWLDRFPNLIVMRTFSKAYGLAGARVGYALSGTEITDLINRVRMVFNPNALAQVAATAALGDAEHIRRTIALNSEQLAVMDAGLKELGFATIPSVCNFVTVDVQRPGREAFEALLQEGVIVRPLDAYGLDNHLRISVGLADQNRRCLEAMGRVLAGGRP